MLRLVVASVYLCSLVVALLDETAPSQSRIDSLEFLLTEEKQLRMKLESKVDSLQLQMNSVQSEISECPCGDSGMDIRPAFMAGLSADILHCSVGQPVIFDSIKVNVGNGYNSQHGVFKAPVPGVYAFAASLAEEPHQMYHVAFVKGNSTNEIGYLYTDPSNIWLGRSTTVLTHLDANDEVWMVCLADSRIEGSKGHSWGGAGDFHSHMSGFLVSGN